MTKIQNKKPKTFFGYDAKTATAKVCWSKPCAPRDLFDMALLIYPTDSIIFTKI